MAVACLYAVALIMSFLSKNNQYVQEKEAGYERRTFIAIGSVRRRRIVWDLPQRTPHLSDYQWSSATVVIQFAADAHDDRPTHPCLQWVPLCTADRH